MTRRPGIHFVAGLVIGVVVASGITFAAASYGPVNRTPAWGFLSGNEWENYSFWYQRGYVAGILDISRVLVGDMVGVRQVVAAWSISRVIELDTEALGDGEAPDGKDALSAYLAGDFATLDPVENLYLDTALGSAARDLHQAFAVPEGVTDQQLVDIVTKYLREHPEERHLSAAYLVWKAVAEAFGG